MHQFTDRDINKIKDKLRFILDGIFIGDFDFNPYIDAKLFTPAQCVFIKQNVKCTYPIEQDPLPTYLQPLIKIAKELIVKNKTAPCPQIDGMTSLITGVLKTCYI